MNSSASINLVKTKTDILDEILKWALSVGRLLIIITEIVAFSAFVYRFTLDRTLIDLHDEINQQQAIVATLEDREAQYRNLHERLGVVSNISKNGNRSVSVLKDITDLTPSDITFNSLTIDGTLVKIDSNVESISSLSSFIASLRKHPQASSVTVDRIDNSSLSTTINVFITLILKEAPPVQ